MNEFITGKAEDVLKTYNDNYIDLVVTSPPYDLLRNYKEGALFDFENIAKQLYRVMKVGGVVVWVVGDAVINKSETGSSFKQILRFMGLGFKLHDTMIYEKNGSSFPARRNGNRYSQLFEYMFILSKDRSPKTANLICDKPNKWAGQKSFGKSSNRNASGELVKRKKERAPTPDFSPRNNIWRYSTGKNYSTKDEIAYKHPAIFPEKLAEDHILTWSVEGDIVLDPFSGSGTTAKMAKKNNRNYIGIDIAEEYNIIAEKRLT